MTSSTPLLLALLAAALASHDASVVDGAHRPEPAALVAVGRTVGTVAAACVWFRCGVAAGR